MRIARYSAEDEVSFGIVEGDTVAQLRGHPFAPVELTGQRLPLDAVRLLAPVLPSKVVAIGKNYADHATEMGGEVPAEPLFFLKPSTSVVGPGDPIASPPSSSRVDYEGELAVVIGRLCRDVPESRAAEVVLGYTCANDVTARDQQKADGQWSRAKGYDTFCPLGPWIETSLDVDDLRLSTHLSGTTKQDSRTSLMVHRIPKLIAHITACMTLIPGDVVLTGTPEGVGPMQVGDDVTVEIEGIGRLTNPVVAVADALGASDGPVRVRVAPSPTGDPHVGTAYMSLFNLAFARHRGGQFLLRVEDTDRARFQADSEQQVYDTLHWLGLDWDEGPDIGGPFAPYRQSERLETYAPVAKQLLEAGHAYHCWCTPQRLTEMREEQQRLKRATGYDRLCLGKTRDERAALPGFSEAPVLRMLVPSDVPLSFVDLVRGEVGAPRPDDQVLMKADGFPTYHLANVVDDHLMGITHVVRGEEWIASTPKHLLLYSWMGWQAPAFAHMPLLRNPDKSKISKRKNPAARLTWFVEEGVLPEALRNFLGLMGYSLPDGREVFGVEDMVATFDWSRVNAVGPVFDVDKLRWLSGHYMRELPVEDVAERLVGFMGVGGDDAAMVRAAAPLVVERVATLREAAEMVGFLVVGEDEYAVDPAAATKQLGDDQQPVVAAAIAALEALPSYTATEVEVALRAALVDGMGLKPKHAFGPVRVAVTGSTVSPPLFESIELLGPERTMRRLRAAQAT